AEGGYWRLRFEDTQGHSVHGRGLPSVLAAHDAEGDGAGTTERALHLPRHPRQIRERFQDAGGSLRASRPYEHGDDPGNVRSGHPQGDAAEISNRPQLEKRSLFFSTACKLLKNKARPGGLEPPTTGLEGPLAELRQRFDAALFV